MSDCALFSLSKLSDGRKIAIPVKIQFIGSYKVITDHWTITSLVKILSRWISNRIKVNNKLLTYYSFTDGVNLHWNENYLNTRIATEAWGFKTWKIWNFFSEEEFSSSPTSAWRGRTTSNKEVFHVQFRSPDCAPTPKAHWRVETFENILGGSSLLVCFRPAIGQAKTE